MKRQTPILDMLREYSLKETVRFHMPGHKGDTGFFGGETLRADITEIEGADNLLNPTGVIAQSQALHARRVGAGESFYSVNGATAGIMAAITAAMGERGTLIMARDAHVSAVNAVTVAGGEIAFVGFEVDSATGLPGCVTPEAIEEEVARTPDARAVYLTYPNYFGCCCDLRGIAAVVHEHGLPLIVDGAHAAAFCYSGMLPEDPGSAGADVWVVSAYKTLPAMGQTAVVNVGQGSLIPAGHVSRALRLYTTTSPSYLLLGSIDYASAYMEDRGGEELFALINNIDAFRERAVDIEGITFPTHDIAGRAGVFDVDETKLAIDVTGRGITGFTAGEILRQNGVYPEVCDHERVLLLCTVADTAASFDRLYEALSYLPRGMREATSFNPYQLPAVESYLPPRDMLWSQGTSVELAHAQGMVCAVSAGVYPPGVPVLLPGNEINAETIDYLTRAAELGYSLFGVSGGMIQIGEV